MSSEAAVTPVEPPRRLRWNWVLPALFRPRQAFARIAAAAGGTWLTPLLILTLAALLLVLAAGPLKSAAAAGQVELPPDFQYYSPEQQAQYQQAMAATSGPVFVYVFPAIMAVGKVWVGWLLVGGLLHLVLTLLGGRGDTRLAMNLVAWAGLPFAVRDLVRTGWMLTQHSLISSTGLSGFAPAGESGLSLFLAGFLALVDIYLVWHLALLVFGVRASNGLSRGKAIGGVLLTVGAVLAVQALLGFLAGKLGAMTIVRPFF